MAVNIIVAVGALDMKRGVYPIGKGGKLPWHNSSDLKRFKTITMGHPVIMGRKTWESIGKPLPGRTNIVVTSQPFIDPELEKEGSVVSVGSVEEAIFKAQELSKEDVFIIGGASIYKYALEKDLVDKMYITYTHVKCEDADAYFPEFDIRNWELEGEVTLIGDGAVCENFIRLRGKDNHVDEQYLKLVNDIIEHGEKKDTRAGKTRSVFGRQLRFNLKEGLPLLTTKKVFTKGIIYELLWFIKGDTNIKYLVDNGVHIWDDDAYRYYLEKYCSNKSNFLILPKNPSNKKRPYLRIKDSITKEEFLERVKNEDLVVTYELHPEICYKFGDLGPVYGKQWTDWGGHNQIQEVINSYVFH